jgi:hypothetical protein
MQDGGSWWRLVVPTGGDALRQERLTRDLYEALRESGSLAVGFEDGEKPVEAGRKGAGPADVALWAAASMPAAHVLITLIKEWCAKERLRTVKVAYRGRSITHRSTGRGSGTDGPRLLGPRERRCGRQRRVTRLIRRKALLIGNERYDDPRFAPLPSTQADIWQLSQVLQHRNIGNFVSVARMANLTANEMQQAITEFLEGCDREELVLCTCPGTVTG